MKLGVLFLFVFLSCSAFSSTERELKDLADTNKIELDQSEKDILYNGELGTARYVVGGILGTYPIGLGIGHACRSL